MLAGESRGHIRRVLDCALEGLLVVNPDHMRQAPAECPTVANITAGVLQIPVDPSPGNAHAPEHPVRLAGVSFEVLCADPRHPSPLLRALCSESAATKAVPARAQTRAPMPESPWEPRAREAAE